MAAQPSLDDATVAFRADGVTYEPEFDERRLGAQMRRVRSAMADGEWRTLAELADVASAPEASVSARLRDLRKRRFGSHVVERRHRGEPVRGLYEYRVVAPR